VFDAERKNKLILLWAWWKRYGFRPSD